MLPSDGSIPPSTTPPDPDRFPILVVEDDSAIGQLVTRTLSAHGYRVTSVSDAHQAIVCVATMPAFILLTDKNLPGLTGLDLIGSLRSTRDSFEAVLMTAYADVDSLARSVELGIFRCLRKPFELSDMLSAVAGAANRLYLRLDRRSRIDELLKRNREIEGAMARLRDSETRRMLSERLASIGQFAASLAHEINNPLSYVRGNLSLLSEGLSELVHLHQRLASGEEWAAIDPDLRANVQRYVFELHPIMQECSEGVKLIHEISRDLRSVARYRHDVNELFDLNDVVRTACRIARIGHKFRAKIALDLHPGSLSVSGSTGRIAQVIMNLVMNAGQAAASDRPNQITVKTWERDRDVFLEISDTGIGIPDARVGSIFEPFVTFKEDGTGIGLWLVREIVSEHRGQVVVESEIGVGTTFRVRIPAAGRETIAPPSTQRRVTHLPDGLRMLVVDDDASIRSVIARTFLRQSVRLADHPEAGTQLIEADKPQVILCDLHMPGTSGVLWREQVALRWPELQNRFVFISGTDAYASEARERAPTCPLVSKPFNVEDLEKAILSLL